MKRVVPLLLLALVAPLAGCGEKEDVLTPSGSKQLTLMLDYFPNADHAGIYAAQAGGHFKQAGLNVEIRQPADPAAPIKQVAAGRVDLAISYEPEVLRARDKGADDLVAVGALVQRPLTSLIALPGSGVRAAKDLAGKRVGTAGIGYQTAYLKTILEKAGVDAGSVKETNVGFDFSRPLIAGRVDATLGAFWNYEGTDLQRRGKKPVILKMDELGVPAYDELVFVARRGELDADGASRLRRFLQATGRGHRLLEKDPSTGIDALMKASSGLERGLQEAAVKATLPAFFPAGGDRPFGWQEPREWDAYGRWMEANGLLKRPPNAAKALTNEFLPGEGLDPGVSGLE
ncbi:MAG: putative hydroxymethylpyrimidine transport system substrate-binding protein [Solirubrobacteraceae bacterium]|nr:putative hydroxymethylpyrimidine transport system substrate-binding protein [Solirubrobacteraceae bacterium]